MVKATLPKVAIIDTGCQLEHKLIKGHVLSETIAGWEDFVEPGRNDDAKSFEDLVGHGTHVTDLFLKTHAERTIISGTGLQDGRGGTRDSFACRQVWASCFSLQISPR